MSKDKRVPIGSFALEIAVYAVLIVGYFYAVLFFLEGRLATLYHHDRTAYAVISLALIIGQGIVLESVTTFLLKLIKRDSE